MKYIVRKHSYMYDFQEVATSEMNCWGQQV